jgi:hypothetical protein
MILRAKLLRFEYEISGTPQSFVILSGTGIEEKEEAKQYVYNKIIEEQKKFGRNTDDIYLVGVSDIGSLHLIAPSVENQIKAFFESQTPTPKRRRKE